MIVAAAFCPHPPVLVPEVAQGAASELDQLRQACRTAIQSVAAPGRQLVALGSAPAWRAHVATARGTLAGFGVPVEVSLGNDAPGPVELPLPLTIGAWLLRDALGPNCGAVGYSVADGPVGNPVEREFTDLAHGKREVALVVMGDGSARRSTAAPGYLDDEAAEYDRWISKALRTPEPHQLHDSGAAGGLMVAGRAVWDEVAWMTEGPDYGADLFYDDAPYGVGYFVAAWQLRG